MDILWADLTVGVSAVAATVYVVRSMKAMNKDMLAFVSNHMSSTTKAQQDVAVALSQLAEASKRLADEVRYQRISNGGPLVKSE
jgi:hypothetical protein